MSITELFTILDYKYEQDDLYVKINYSKKKSFWIDVSNKVTVEQTILQQEDIEAICMFCSLLEKEGAFPDKEILSYRT